MTEQLLPQNEIENQDVFDLDVAEFENLDFDDDLDFTFETEQKRYINPGRKDITAKSINFRNALQLAKEIGIIKRDDRFFVMLPGTFVFGDFLEAWIIQNQYNVLEMTISTLSLSQNNVDSLVNLIEGDYIQKLDMIVSDYFYSHERNQLIGYMYHELDHNDIFQLAVARVHTKVCLMRTACGRKITIHGSANLRTSGNVEQIMIECDEDLFNFNDSWHKEIITKYQTINKTVGGDYLWGQDQADGQSTTHQKDIQANQNGQKQIMKQISESQHLPDLGDQQHQKDTQTQSRSKGKGAW